MGYSAQCDTNINNYRGFWAVILFLSLSVCVYMINKIWIKYTENPLVISFETKTSFLQDIPFPAVTICPEAKFSNYKFNYSDIVYKLENKEDVTADEYYFFYIFKMTIY